jgi:HK97 family phage major capsid protein
MSKADRVKQYNAAGDALNKAVEVVRAASDEDMPEAEAQFRTAQAEFDRCSKNLELADEIDKIAPVAARQVDNPNHLDMPEAEVRRYSLMRALRAAATGDWSEAGLEREASDEIAKRLNKPANGFYVPMDVQERALTTGDATYAGNLVGTDLLGGSFIDLLRNALVVRKAGATFLGGLVGNVAIPRATGAATAYWVGSTSNAAITGESYPTVDQITMTPKTVGAYTDIGRSLLLQSSVDVEQMVRKDLATIIALAIDQQALYGTGATVYPKGVAAQTNVGSVAGGTNGLAPTWANIVSLETEVAADNADVANMAYIINAKTRGYLKSTPKVASTAGMMWDNGSTPVNGYAAHVSNVVRSNLTKASGSSLSEIYFGNWADLVIGQWGTLDVTADPYTGATAGTLRIVALQDVDVAVRHGESFSRMADAIV